MSISILQKRSVSRVEIDSMREILFLYYPDYMQETYDAVAQKLNEEFNRDDITGELLFNLDEPSVEDEAMDRKLNYTLNT